MNFKKRKNDSENKKEYLSRNEKSALFVNGAETSEKVKHLNMRFTESELKLLKNEAKSNGRSMHAHLKWLFFQSISNPK